MLRRHNNRLYTNCKENESGKSYLWSRIWPKNSVKREMGFDKSTFLYYKQFTFSFHTHQNLHQFVLFLNIANIKLKTLSIFARWIVQKQFAVSGWTRHDTKPKISFEIHSSRCFYFVFAGCNTSNKPATDNEIKKKNISNSDFRV